MSTTDTGHDFDDRNNFNDPPNWASLIWRLTKTRPVFWMFALLSLYVGVRMFSDVDPLDPAIDTVKGKVGIATAIPDLTGEWEYTANDNTGKEWGGVITISVSKEGRIEKIAVHGKRTWEQNVGGERVRISNPVPWKTLYAAYLDNNKVVYHYSTQESVGRSIEGETYLTTYATRNGTMMDGNFSDVYETNPRFGNTTLRRSS